MKLLYSSPLLILRCLWNPLFWLFSTLKYLYINLYFLVSSSFWKVISSANDIKFFNVLYEAFLTLTPHPFFLMYVSSDPGTLLEYS